MLPPDRHTKETASFDALQATDSVLVLDQVLARLPAADVERATARLRQMRQRLVFVSVATLFLLACLGPQTSDLATRSLALLLAVGVAWKALVAVLLGGVAVLPTLSAMCLLAISAVLWQRLISIERRGLR